MSVKTPTSSLSGTSANHPLLFHLVLRCVDTVIAIELLANQLWYRNKAKIKPPRGETSADAPTVHPSPISNLPQELVERIISYFIHDKHTLIACSTTCYSWYIAAVPHLHHTLTTDNHPLRDKWTEECVWPKPLRNSYKLGLLPLVKRLRIRLEDRRFSKFTPKQLGWRTLSYFSALTNLQELGIDNLQVSKFTPNLKRYFRHISPTLRFLALKEPEGSCRQILYFIGFFPNLQDLKLHYPIPRDERESATDARLVPLSVPPLPRGRLTLTCFTRENIVKEVISLFGGLRFRQMDLFGVNCVRLLLSACAETLETLRLYPTDLYREEFLKKKRERTQVRVL
jgi:hypothetical protein